MGRSDYEHWLKGTPFLWLLVLILIEAALERLLRPVRQEGPLWFRVKQIALPAVLSALLVGYACVNTSLAQAFDRLTHLAFPPWSPLLGALPSDRIGGTELDPSQREALDKTIQHIKKYVKEGEPFYIFTDESPYYFFVDAVNPTRYANVSYIAGDKMSEEVLRSLKSWPPKCIMAYAASMGGEIKYKPHHKRIAEFIRSNYRIAERWGPYVFLVPR
jgi:hypothetical protein